MTDDMPARVQRRYDTLMLEGKHGHYETLFQIVREELARRWQPIASAPRDGTEVDLWMACGARVANCRWGKPFQANWGDRFGCDTDLPEGWMTRSGFALDRRNGEPTHWMQEPERP